MKRLLLHDGITPAIGVVVVVQQTGDGATSSSEGR